VVNRWYGGTTVFWIMMPNISTGSVILKAYTAAIFRSDEEKIARFLRICIIQLPQIIMSWIRIRQWAKDATHIVVMRMLSVFCEVEVELLNMFQRNILLQSIRATGNVTVRCFISGIYLNLAWGAKVTTLLRMSSDGGQRPSMLDKPFFIKTRLYLRNSVPRQLSLPFMHA
jgi:hypothetical protein